MKRQTELLELNSDDELFIYLNNTFRNKITTFDWFVNWEKVFRNLEPIETELNLLNVLIGKEDINSALVSLIIKYPNVIKAFPYLIASREKSFEVLIDIKNFISHKFDFTIKEPTQEDAEKLASFILQSGLADILKDKKIKSLVDYAVGVEVGLDSNGRKNRSGTMMEGIVEVFIEDFCTKNDAEYLSEATAKTIKAKWGIELKVDKSSRRIDFVIFKNNKLYLIEVNFYSGGGSKLKSTATEYIEMYNRYHEQGYDFIWITDGAGWKGTQRPLREYYDRADYLLNIEMLSSGILEKIILWK
ncbi:MAG: type II restriction endonuclease [Bacteroidales bacterium]